MNAGFAFALAAAVTWGLVYAIDQKLLAQTSPLTLLFLDSLITAAVLVPFIWFQAGELRHFFHAGTGTTGLLVLSALLAILAGWFILAGIQLIGAAEASVIEIAYPFFVVLFSIILYGFEPTMPFIAGGLLIFAGASLITWFS